MGFPSKEELHERVEHNHGYHRPEYQETMTKMGAIRQETAGVAHKLIELCPAGRELSIALTHLEDACMYGIAALARNEPHGDTPNTTSHPLPGDPGYVSPPSHFDNPDRNQTPDSGQRS